MDDSLLVRQEHVDGAAKQSEGMLADINQRLATVVGTLNPANPESWTGHKQTISSIVGAAQALSDIFADLAAVSVAKQWQYYLEKALNAEGDADKTMGAVSLDLRSFLVVNSNQLEEILYQLGQSAHIFKQHVIQRTAATAAVTDMMIRGDAALRVACTEFGVDYAAVITGDKDALKRVLEANAAKKGEPLDPRVYAALGLPGSDAAQDNGAQQAAEAAVSEAANTFGGAVVHEGEPASAG